jgi:hypothetical protein
MSERGHIPAKHTDCSYCIAPKEYGVNPPGPCRHHYPKDLVGPWNGTYEEYTGSDVYEPTDWVLEVVGAHYRYYDGGGPRIYRCIGYDPRSGFWMRTIDDGPERKTCVSERAIGGSFHRYRGPEATEAGPSKAEHIRWAKQRALQALEHSGKPADALGSLASDFTKHPETNTQMMRELVTLGMLTATGSKEEAKRFVEGFAE